MLVCCRIENTEQENVPQPAPTRRLNVVADNTFERRVTDQAKEDAHAQLVAAAQAFLFRVGT